MQIFDTKGIIKIEDDDLNDAKLSSMDFVDESTKKRAFINVLGARLAIKMLFSKKIEANNVYSLYTIHNVLEELDIADIYFAGIKIDVRLVFNRDEIFIPKSHFKYDILPDLYLVLKLKEDFSAAEPLGFFEPEALDKEKENKDFYFYEYENLNDPKDLKTFLKTFEVKDRSIISESDGQRAEELFLSLADKEISEEDKTEKPDETGAFAAGLAIGGAIVGGAAAAAAAAATIGISAEGEILKSGAEAISQGTELFGDLVEGGIEVISEGVEFASDMLESSDNEPQYEEQEQEQDDDEQKETFNLDEFDFSSLNENIGTLDDINEMEIPFDVGLNESQPEENIYEETTPEGEEEEILLEIGEESQEEKSFEESSEFDFSSLNEDIGTLDDINEMEIPFDVGLSEPLSEINVDSENLNLEETLPELRMDNLEEIEPLQEETEVDKPISSGFNFNFTPLVDEPIEAIEELPEEDSVNTDFYSSESFDSESKLESESESEEFDFEKVKEQIDENLPIEEEPYSYQTSDDFLFEEEEEEEPSYNQEAVSDDTDDFLFEVDDLLNNIDLSDDDRNILENTLNLVDEKETSLLPSEAIYNQTEALEPPTTNEYNLLTEGSNFADENDPLQVLFKKGQISEGPELETQEKEFIPSINKDKKMVIAASVASVVLVSMVIGGSIIHNKVNDAKFANKPTAPIAAQAPIQNGNEQNAVPSMDTNQQMNEANMDPMNQQVNNSGSNPEAQTGRDMGQSVSDAFLSEPVNASISKVAWEIPEDLAYNDAFRSYLQVAGKNIKLNLQNDLLLATEMAYSNKVIVNLIINKDGSLQTETVATSSGSKQIDKIVLQSVKETLKYLKMPSSEIRGNSVDATLIINF